MRSFKGKRYWLVGASDGLGAALARQLSDAGAEVILSARRADVLEELAQGLTGPAMAVAMDVADADSVTRAVARVGEVDGLVMLAAVYWPMSTQEIDADQAVAMFDINVTGTMRVVAQVVPGMVARGAGHVVLTGSLSGFRGLPGTFGYSSSKAAVMHLAECMYYDLKGTGIDVQVANPGFIRTRLTEKNTFSMPFLMEPEGAAEAMLTHMRSKRFKKSFPRVFSWLFRVSQFFPDWLYYRIFA